MVAITRMGVTHTRAMCAAARAAGVNTTSWAILSELALDGWLTNGQLAERLGMSTGGVTPALDRLASMGYLERSPNPADRRSSIVSLTAEGRRTLGRIADALEASLEESLGHFDDGERALAMRVADGITGAYVGMHERLAHGAALEGSG
jgi:DNA-binding MarR family transcriptional regulator